MAQPTGTINDAANSQASEVNKPQPSAGDNPQTLTIIPSTTQVRGRILVYGLAADKHSLNSTEGLVFNKKSVIEINLGNPAAFYDSVAFRVGNGRPYEMHKRSKGNILTIDLQDEQNKKLSGIFTGNDIVFVEIKSSSRPEISGVISYYLTFYDSTKDDDAKEDAAKKQQRAEEAQQQQGGARRQIVREFLNDSIGAIPKSLSEGFKKSSETSKAKPIAGAAFKPVQVKPQEDMGGGGSDNEFSEQPSEQELEPKILPETLQQSAELVGEFIDKNPQLVVNAQTRNNILSALQTGQLFNLSSQEKQALAAVVFQLPQEAMNPQLRFALQHILETALAPTEEEDVEAREPAVSEALSNPIPSDTVNPQVDNVATVAATPATATIDAKVLQQSASQMGEFLYSNPQAISYKNSRERIVTALSNGKLEDIQNLSEEDKATLKTTASAIVNGSISTSSQIKKAAEVVLKAEEEGLESGGGIEAEGDVSTQASIETQVNGKGKIEASAEISEATTSSLKVENQTGAESEKPNSSFNVPQGPTGAVNNAENKEQPTATEPIGSAKPNTPAKQPLAKPVIEPGANVAGPENKQPPVQGTEQEEPSAENISKPESSNASESQLDEPDVEGQGLDAKQKQSPEQEQAKQETPDKPVAPAQPSANEGPESEPAEPVSSMPPPLPTQPPEQAVKKSKDNIDGIKKPVGLDLSALDKNKQALDNKLNRNKKGRNIRGKDGGAPLIIPTGPGASSSNNSEKDEKQQLQNAQKNPQLITTPQESEDQALTPPPLPQKNDLENPGQGAEQGSGNESGAEIQNEKSQPLPPPSVEQGKELGQPQTEPSEDSETQDTPAEPEFLEPQPDNQGKNRQATEKDLDFVASLINAEMSRYLNQAAWWVWGLSIETLGFSVLIGAVLGDLVLFMKKFLIKRALQIASVSRFSKESGTMSVSVDQLVDRVKFSGSVKAHIIAMNAMVGVILACLILFFIIVLKLFCANVVVGGLSLMAGEDNVCTAINKIPGSSLSDYQSYVNGTPGQAAPSNVAYSACKGMAVGDASVSALAASCFGQDHAATASIVAFKESGGNPFRASGVDICQDSNGNNIMVNGQPASVSWGLFQINISAHKIGNLNCPAAFDKMYTGSNKQCTILNLDLYNQCVNAAKDSQTNIQTACQISGNGNSFTAWGSWSSIQKECNLP